MYLPFVIASTLHIHQPVKRRKDDEAFKTEALRLTRESRSARAAQQLDISETLLYRWRRAEAAAGSAAQAQDPEWRALRAEVHVEGHRVGRGRIRRVLAAHGLWAQQPRSFAPRATYSGHGRRVALNRLQGQPPPTAPNRVWVGDITCLPKQGGGWLYLTSWQDACSRKVVGWDVREIMPEDLVSEALRWALVVRQPPAGLIVHSNQGS